MVRVQIKLYSFHELSERSREKAISDHRQFLLEIMQPEDFISGDPAYDSPEQLQAAYNAEYEYYCMNDEPIIDSIECNEYLFYYNGDLANTTLYHWGETVLKIGGECYPVEVQQ